MYNCFACPQPLDLPLLELVMLVVSLLLVCLFGSLLVLVSSIVVGAREYLKVVVGCVVALWCLFIIVFVACAAVVTI